MRPERATAIVDTQVAAMSRQISPDSIRASIEKLVSFGTRHSLSDTASSAAGIGAARRWVVSKLRQFARQHHADMRVTLEPCPVAPGRRVPYPVTMKNVVAILRGADTTDSRIIVVSGHLDSRNTDVMDSVGLAPGANDDASGVAVVLELARVISAKRFPCTLIFMAVQGEEQGLLGAACMAEKLKESGANVIAMLNNDIVGNTLASETGDRNAGTVRLFSEMIPAAETDEQARARAMLRAENDSPSRQLARYVREAAQPYLKDFTVTLSARPDRFLRGGDHIPFSRQGFSAVRFTEFNENFNQQHQTIREENGIEYGDLLKFVDCAYAANVARVNLIAITSLAKAPAAPRDVKMKMNLDNLTHLQWSAPATGPSPKGYYVLMRETIQPFWEKKFFVSDTAVSLPYSKDNYFFAVQSVGAEGHVSLPVTPVPGGG
ncbi:MAG TPA: M28 family metallopeptidase [Chryseosolibacter sp.]